MADSAKPSNKRKRAVLTITQKLDIIRRLERGENKQDLMRKFNIGSSTIYDIKLQKDKLMKFASSAETSKASDERRTLQQPQHEKLDKILYDWFLLKREEGIPISGPMLMEKARDFSEKLNIAKEYLDQIYNADETGAYLRCLPTSTLTGPNEISAHGFKKNKERLTVLTCANATGSHKIKLLVIGKSKNPRALTGIKHLPIAYKNQKNCWMDGDIFIYWFKCIFVPSVISELKAKGKPEDSKVILLIDNCRAHPSDAELRHGNISAMFLPPNVTSLIQPMDQGIIQNLKMIYRKNFMRRLINAEGTLTEFQSSFTIKDAIYGLASSWNTVKPRTLRRGWRKLLFVTHFCSDSSDDEEFEGFRCKKSELTDIMEALKNGCTKNLSLTQLEMPEIEIWMNVDKNIPVTETLTEEELIRKMIAPEEETNDISSESDDEKSSEEKISWGEAEKSLSTFLQFCEKNAQYSAEEVMEFHLIKERFMEKKRTFFQANIH
ncbi:Jerky [Araneus ventricosus]|uniref:Jerky n=1 Tax=Araneus ventricosus TaxID=182803 RepID=A0A4Y2CYK8_ARAVE|nr:Jerky [Araneus ventricosus]